MPKTVYIPDAKMRLTIRPRTGQIEIEREVSGGADDSQYDSVPVLLRALHILLSDQTAKSVVSLQQAIMDELETFLTIRLFVPRNRIVPNGLGTLLVISPEGVLFPNGRQANCLNDFKIVHTRQEAVNATVSTLKALIDQEDIDAVTDVLKALDIFHTE